MKSLFLILILFSTSAFAEGLTAEQNTFAHSKAKALNQEFTRYGIRAIASRTDQALENLVGLGVAKLRLAGDPTAAKFESDWQDQFQGFVQGYVNQGRDIGDHPPIAEWLAVFYDHLVSVLGIDVCKSLHLSDIQVFNFAIPVVFRPCTFSMDLITIPRKDEYRKHFAEGALYWGLIPVVTYWAVDIACDVASHGAGVVWLCGSIGSVAERVMGKRFAPIISDIVFNKTCGN